MIGRRASGVSPRRRSYVAGVTAFDDMSARNWQKSDGQWARAKGFDTFAPFGPYVAYGLSPLDLALELRVNGETRQRARSSQMHFGPAFLVSHVSRHMTLPAGDLIATGTPAGIAPLEPGTWSKSRSGVGVLRHRERANRERAARPALHARPAVARAEVRADAVLVEDGVIATVGASDELRLLNRTPP